MTKNTANLHKFVVRDWLSKVAGAEAGRTISIGRGIRGRDYENRNAIEFVTGSNLPEHFKPIDFREIQIEEQHMGLWRGGIFFCFGNKLESAFAIRRDENVQRQVFHSDGFANEQGVRQVVFSQQKIQRLPNALVEPVRGR